MRSVDRKFSVLMSVRAEREKPNAEPAKLDEQVPAYLKGLGG